MPAGVHPGRVPAQAVQVGGQADPLLHDVSGGLIQGQRQKPQFRRDLPGGLLISRIVLAGPQDQYLGRGGWVEDVQPQWVGQPAPVRVPAC